MRKFYAPVVVLGVMAAMAIAGGVMQGQQAKDQAKAEAGFLDMQADQERKQLARDQEDLAREQDRTESRQRALLAAGGGMDAGSDLAILTETSAAFSTQSTRMTDDSTFRSTLLNTKASNTRKAGQQAQNAAIFGGVMKAGSSLYKMPRAA